MKQTNTNTANNYATKSLYFTLGGLVTITLLSGALLSSSIVSADNDSVTDQVEITVPTSCTMSGTGQTSHTATIDPGTYSAASGSEYANGIGKTTITALCNDYNGFSIYAIGFTNSEEGNNVLKGTSASGNATIATKAYESTDTTSNWSMKLTKVTDTTVSYNPNNMTITTGYDNYHSVPDDYTKVVEYKASTGSSATDQTLGAKLETTYAAFISTTQPADTYTGQVKYVMVHPYNGTAPHIPVSFDSAYAAAGKQKLNGYYKMQDMNSAICTAVDEDEVGEVIDARDNTVYHIAKLKDSKCWMTDNLDIAGGTALSADNTDVTNEYITNFSTSNLLTKGDNTIILPTSSTSGFSTDNYAYVYNSNSTTCGNNSPCYSYYSWDAATLGSGRSISTNNTDAAHSICAKGWKLPTDGDHRDLAISYGMSTETLFDVNSDFYTQAGAGTTPNFFLSGSYHSGSFNGGDEQGGYWSSTSSSNNSQAFILFFGTGMVGVSYSLPRSAGFAIRCLIPSS